VGARSRLDFGRTREGATTLHATRDGPHDNLPVLVTGCGRSGTRFTTFVLRRLGLDVGHERLGKDGIASWALAVEADVVPWGPSLATLTFDVVLHQTRHPLRVANSVVSFREESWRFICDHVPCSLDDPLPLRAAAYWYHWNIAAEVKADVTFRVEDIRSSIGAIATKLGVEADASVLDRVPTDVNTRRNGRLFHLAEEALERLHVEPMPRLRAWLARPATGKPLPQIDWDDIRALDPSLCDRVQSLARRYGYVI
jgi:hypothetical protein